MEITLRGQQILTMDEFKQSKTHTALLKCGHMLVDDRPLVFRYAMPIVTVGAASLLAS